MRTVRLAALVAAEANAERRAAVALDRDPTAPLGHEHSARAQAPSRAEAPVRGDLHEPAHPRATDACSHRDAGPGWRGLQVAREGDQGAPPDAPLGHNPQRELRVGAESPPVAVEKSSPVCVVKAVPPPAPIASTCASASWPVTWGRQLRPPSDVRSTPPRPDAVPSVRKPCLASAKET